ncbi:MAG TPA: hypothetical protein VIA63_10240 [Candidatus Limnocylindria bacterium]
MLRIAALAVAFLAIRIFTAAIVAVPGYTDAYYYVSIAEHVARGDGLVADFVWSPLEAPRLEDLPVPSNRFWMPLVSLVQAAGIAALGGLLGPFRAAQLVSIVFAVLVPVACYVAARSLGANERWALLGAALVGMGGLFLPAWVTLDSYGLAAIVGTIYFLALARAARGESWWGAVAGSAVGALFLARAEGSILGLGLLALVVSPRTRRAGLTGSAVALVVGAAWLARDSLLGGAGDVFARSVLLVRYEDLFALRGPTLDAFLANGADVMAAKLSALGSNAVTFLFAFAILPVAGLVAGARATWGRPEVRAFVGLAVAVYLAESVVWTLHSTRGSYVHSLAAFLPFGFAIAAVGGQTLLASASAPARGLAVAVAVAMCLVISVAALAQFDPTFGASERSRRAAVDAIPAGPFLALDASAWHWIAGRPVIVTPSDGPDAAACLAARYGARSLVLEAAHLGAYDALYASGGGVAWLDAPVDRGAIRIFPVRGDLVCATAR